MRSAGNGCERSPRSRRQGSVPARSPQPGTSTSSSRRNRIDRTATRIPLPMRSQIVGEQFARHASVIFSPDGLEPDFLQDTSTSGVVYCDVGVQRPICGMGQVPGHQGGTDLARQALPPQVTSNGVAQFPAVSVRPETGSTDEAIIEVSQTPFREACRGVLSNVLIDESRSFSSRLGPALTHKPHRLRVRVHDQQVVDAAGEPRSHDQPLGPQYALAQHAFTLPRHPRPCPLTVRHTRRSRSCPAHRRWSPPTSASAGAEHCAYGVSRTPRRALEQLEVSEVPAT